jgi:nicotinamidase-related amidase
MNKLMIDSKTTALVLIDLQKGMLGMPLAPLSADQVVASARALGDHFRRLGVPVVLVNLDYPATREGPKVDFAMPMPQVMPPAWDELVEGLAHAEDTRITKRGWSAFQSTDLDRRLKSRGIDTIVIGGIATNFGVEATARDAVALNYSVIFAKDAMTTLSPQHQDFALSHIFPLIGRVRSSADIMA